MKIDWVLLKRSVLSDISEEERNLLNAWLDESSEHREFYREIKTFLCSPESFRPTEERIRRFKASYEARLTVAERRKRRHRMVRIGGWVAALCLLFMVAGDFIRKRALIDRKPADGDYFARNTKGYFGNR